MSDLFLLGAGASYGSLDCTPYCPPLGPKLFAELRKRGGIAATINSPLRELFEDNFERGMAAFREVRDEDSTAFLRQMAEYFVQFAAGPRNLYRELISITKASKRSTTLVTTNYDLLIEQVITEAGLLVAYHGRPVPESNVPLLKIHGSCHFLPDLGSNRITGAIFSGNGANVETRIKIARSRAEVSAFCRTEDSLAPAIALYAPGKKVLFSPSAVAEQQREWHRELARADILYSIGLRVVIDDDHIWGALASSTARIEYVGFEPDEFQSWAGAVSRKNAHVLAKDFASALPLIRARST